jgi:SAM-dependent methyltransferase
MTGVSGINSMWWAAQGISVTVVDNNRDRLQWIAKVWKEIPLQAEFVYRKGFDELLFDDDSFDLGWNFAALWYVPDLERFLEELVRVTRRSIFICVPNRWGLGYLSRFAFKKNQFSNLKLDNLKPQRILSVMDRLGWQNNEKGYFDVPPWPDIAMKKEDFLKKIGVARLIPKTKNKAKPSMCIIDYFNGNNVNMEQYIMKYSFLENTLAFLKIFWAHHKYYVFIPK